MKAVISNRIYMEVTKEYKEILNKELTYMIPTYNPNDPPLIIKNMARIRTDLVTIPVGRTDLIPEDYEIVDKRITVPAELPPFRGELRQSQADVHDDIEDNAIINAQVSWGKTFTGLAIAAKLGQKTLIIVHTIALRNQWEREVEKVYGISPGIIGSGRFEIDSPIVIGNTQSLYKKVTEIRKAFGTIILDEMHHVSSPTFSRLLDSNHARYKIGLSGTIKRKDGKHVVFTDYFGHKLYQPPRENSMTPEVHTIKTAIRFPDGSSTPWANRVNALTNNEEYRHLIAITAAAYAAKGHKVLIVSDRVHFLHYVAELIGEKAVAVTGRIKDQKEREALINQIHIGEKDILCGTQSIFAEGISVNPLSCLILGTPINNDPLLMQLIGRIIRIHPGKQQPVVVDIHLKGNTATKQASNRMGHYIKEGYEIKQL